MSTSFLSRWALLNEDEKQVAYLYVVKGQKLESISVPSISAHAMPYVIRTIFRLTGVIGKPELAFEMGKHWADIKGEIER